MAYDRDQWNHIVVSYLDKSDRLEIYNSYTGITYTWWSFRENALNQITMQSEYIVCFQIYDKYFNWRDEKDQMKLCPNRHATNACEGSFAECGFCDEMTGEWINRKSNLQLVGKDCHHALEDLGLKPAIHITFDRVDINKHLKSRVNSDNFIKFNGTFMTMGKGYINTALCLHQEEDTTLLSDPCIEESCFLAVWILHHCEYNGKLIISTHLFSLQCDSATYENEYHMAPVVLHYNDCKYKGFVRAGFWYHLNVIIKPTNEIEIYVDGSKTYFNQERVCDGAYQPATDNRIVIGNTSKELCLDELVIYNHEVHPTNADIYKVYVEGINVEEELAYWTLPFLYSVLQPHLYVDLFNEVHKPAFVSWQKGEVKSIINQTDDQVLFHIDLSSAIWGERSTYIYVTTFIYFQYMNQNIYDALVSVTDNKFYSTNERISMGNSLTVSTPEHLLNISKHATLDLIDSGKTFLVFRINGLKSHLVPLVSITIGYNNKEKYNDFSFSNASYKNIDLVNVTSLEPYSKYKICIIPNPSFGIYYIKELCYFFTEFYMTLEGEPIEKPIFSCKAEVTDLEELDIEAANRYFTCTIVQIHEDNWKGQPHGYEIYWLPSNTIIGYNESQVDHWNFTTFENESLLHNSNSFDEGVRLDAKLVFELYTVVVRATTQMGFGKGVANILKFRSYEGAPDKIEANFSISSNLMHPDGKIYVDESFKFDKLSEVDLYVNTVGKISSEIHFKWDTFSDFEIWNANKSSYIWSFIVEYGEFFDIRESENKKINLTTLQEFNELTVNDSDRTMMYSVNFYACSIKCRSFTEKKCILTDFTYPSPKINASCDALDSFSINISMSSFIPYMWRGKHKYFLVIACSYLSNSSISTMELAYGLYDNSNYWIKTFKRNIELDLELENSIEKFVGRSKPCNDTLISLYTSMKTKKNFIITDLHPSIVYKLTILPCNELGCSIANAVVKNITMPEYKPSAGPSSVNLTNTSTTSFKVQWGEISFKSQLGTIILYTVYLNIPRTNITLTQNTTDRFIHFNDNIDIYDYACVYIAGWTSYQEKGENSNITCSHADEDVPVVAPQVVNVTSNSSTTLTIQVTKPNEYLIHGVLRGIEIIYKPAEISDINLNCRANLFGHIEVQVKHEDFFSNDEDFFIYIDELNFYTSYNLSLTYFTSKGSGYNISQSTGKTAEDVPNAPINFTGSVIDEGVFNLTWEDIPQHEKKGVILKFVIYSIEIIAFGAVGSKRTEMTNNAYSFWHIFDGLNVDKVYNFSIAGITAIGAGENNSITLEFDDFTNGNWSDWTLWTKCSASCGSATKTRLRFCNNPAPNNGGKNCSGEYFQIEECPIINPCPMYILADNCNECMKKDLSCSTLIETDNTVDIFLYMNLSCANDDSGKNWTQFYHPGFYTNDQKCVGYDNVPSLLPCHVEKEVKSNYKRICNCISENDVGLTSWGAWTPCSVTCGDEAIKTRSRKCIAATCIGDTFHKETCDVPQCEVDGIWGSWSELSKCSKPCGGGKRVKKRKCDNPTPKHGGRECIGVSVVYEDECNTHFCPQNGGWSEWDSWSSCTRPCGIGKQTRRRECNNPVKRFGGIDCNHNHAQEIETCIRYNCTKCMYNLVMTFTNETHSFKYNYLNSVESLALAKKICRNFLRTVLKMNEAVILDCVIKSFKPGSVIADFTVTYEFYDFIQLIQLYDILSTEKKLGTMPIGEYRATVQGTSCYPATNIRSTALSSSTVNIKWDMQPCNNGATEDFVYIMYADRSKSFENTQWDIHAIYGGISETTMKYLDATIEYKAHIVYGYQTVNGMPSDIFYFSLPPSPPSMPPFSIYTVSTSPTEVFIEWKDIPTKGRNGDLTGYKVMYKLYHESKYKVKVISFGFQNTLLERLVPFSLYAFEICGFNDGGNGPTDYNVVKTLEGVPSVSPNVIVNDMQAIDWWSVQWDSIPKNKHNGVLRGYRLIYYLSYQSGQQIGGEITRTTRDFDIYTFYHKETSLKNYATYNITVTGFTNAGEGPAPENFARTCKCAENIFANWIIKTPYTYKSNKELHGIFPTYLKIMINKLCGKCEKYSQSSSYYLVTKHGVSPDQKTEEKLKNSVSNDVDLSFPVYGRFDLDNMVPDSIFIPLINSPGCAIVIRDGASVHDTFNRMINGVLKLIPFLIVSYLIATMFGIFIWFTDQFTNPEEFVLGSSIKGPLIGFWFSFVTMTTIGYGDINAKSYIARFISMIWFLVGMVLNTLIISFVTTSIMTVGITKEIKLYGTKTAAINGTFEYRYAVTRNAMLHKDKLYRNIYEVLEALENKEVDAALLDIYSMVSYKNILKKKSLKVKTIINTKTGYGFILSGLSKVLKEDIKSYIYATQSSILNYIKTLENEIPVIQAEIDGEEIQNLFSEDTIIFINSVKYMGITIAGLVFCGIIYEIIRNVKNRISPAPSNHELLQYLATDIHTFFGTTFKDKIIRKCEKHENEVTKLLMLKYTYQRSVSNIGKYQTDTIVENCYDNMEIQKIPIWDVPGT